jgi:hypothetical protein
MARCRRRRTLEDLHCNRLTAFGVVGTESLRDVVAGDSFGDAVVTGHDAAGGKCLCHFSASRGWRQCHP